MKKKTILLLLAVVLLTGCQAVKREGQLSIVDANTVTYKGHRMALKYSDGKRTVEVDAREEGIFEGALKLLIPWLWTQGD